jgi:hypothetical protein
MANRFAELDKQQPTQSATKKPNRFAQLDQGAQAPTTDNTPTQAPETFGNGTGFTGAVTGIGRGLASAYETVKNVPGEIAQAATDIKHQYDTGTLFTPEFQQESTLEQAGSLAGGLLTGAKEAVRGAAQLPNEVINTTGALYDSIAGNSPYANDVDIYSVLPQGAQDVINPQTPQGKAIGNILPTLLPVGKAGEVAKVHAISMKSLSDRGIPLTSENIAQEDTKNAALALLGIGAFKGAGKAADFAGEIPGALTGRASLGTTSRALGRTNETLYQGGDVQAQQAARGVITDAQGNITAPDSGLFQGEGYAGLRGAGNRRGDLNPEATQQNINRTLDELQAANGVTAQEGVGKAVDEFRAVKNQEYADSLNQAQSILDSKRVTSLSMKRTKDFIKQHLDEDEGLDSLPSTTKSLLKKMQSSDYKSLPVVDFFKRKLGNEINKAYRAGDMDTAATLNTIKGHMKTELDSTLRYLDPQAANTYTKADKLFSDYVDVMGKRSKAAKVAGNTNDELAARSLVGNTASARGNVADIAATVKQMQNDARFANGADIAEQFNVGMGNTARDFAHEEALAAADKARNSPTYKPGDEYKAYARTFNSKLTGSQRNLSELGGLPGGNQSAINQALAEGVQTSQAQLANSDLLNTVGSVAAAKIPVLGKLAVEPVTNAIGRGVDFATMRGLRSNAMRNTVQNATPEEIATMRNMYANSPERMNLNPSTVAAAASPQQDQSNGYVTITLPPQQEDSTYSTAEINQEPEQHAQVARRTTTNAPTSREDQEAKRMYQALAHAETGGLDNRFIRTKAKDKSSNLPSTAYGAVQMTHNTMEDFYKNHTRLFSEQEQDYIHRFLDMGTKMKHADDKDSVYGYGGVGTLGGKEDRRMYAQVMQKVLKQRYKELGSWSKVMHWWRGNGVHDPKYFAKVTNHLRNNH